MSVKSWYNSNDLLKSWYFSNISEKRWYAGNLPYSIASEICVDGFQTGCFISFELRLLTFLVLEVFSIIAVFLK